MSALSVWSGTLPSLNFSDLAISAPPNLPPQTILIPFAPNLIADCPDFFIAFLKATRFSNCLAIESATNDASVSGFLISLISSDIFLSDNFDKLFLSFSISAPFLPIRTPGLEVWIIILRLAAALSIITELIPAIA